MPTPVELTHERLTDHLNDLAGGFRPRHEDHRPLLEAYVQARLAVVAAENAALKRAWARLRLRAESEGVLDAISIDAVFDAAMDATRPIDQNTAIDMMHALAFGRDCGRNGDSLKEMMDKWMAREAR